MAFKLFNPCQPCCQQIPSSGGCQFCNESNVNLYAHFTTISGDCPQLDNICVLLECLSGSSIWYGTRSVDGVGLDMTFSGGNYLTWSWQQCTNFNSVGTIFLEQICSGSNPYSLFLSSGIEPFACSCFDGNSLFNIRVDKNPCGCCQYNIPDTLCVKLYRDTSLGGSGGNEYPYCPCIMSWEGAGVTSSSGYNFHITKIPNSGQYWYGSTTSALCNVPLAIDFRCAGDGVNISGFANLTLDNVVHKIEDVGMVCPTSNVPEGNNFQVDGNVHIKQHQFFSGEGCFCLAGSGIHLRIEPTGAVPTGCLPRGLLPCCDGTLVSVGSTSGFYHGNLHGSVISSPSCCFDGLDFTLHRLADDTIFDGAVSGCSNATDPNRPHLRFQCFAGSIQSGNTFLTCSGVTTTFLSGTVESCCPTQVRLYLKTKHDPLASGCCNANINTEVLITE